jgi:hypothetical protein
MANSFRPFSGGRPVTTKRPYVSLDAGAEGYAPAPSTSEVRHDSSAPIAQRVESFFKPAQSPLYDVPVLGGALRSLVESPIGKAAQFGMEGFRRIEEIGQGALTAGMEFGLEKLGGGPGVFRNQIATQAGPAHTPFDALGAAGDVVAQRRGELPSFGITRRAGDEPFMRLDLLDAVDAAIPLPMAKAGAALRGRPVRVQPPQPRALPAPRAPLALPPGKAIPMSGAMQMPPPAPRPISADAIERRLAQAPQVRSQVNVPLDAEQVAAQLGRTTTAQRAVSEDLARQVSAREARRGPLHDADDAVIAAMRDIVDAPRGSENYAALEQAVREVYLLGGDLSRTAQRLRDAGLPAPSADDVRLARSDDAALEGPRVEGEQTGTVYVGAEEVQGLRPGDYGEPVRRAAPNVFRAAEDAGLTVDNGEVMLGGWRGGTEKSLELHVSGGVDQMEYAAAVAGKTHNRDAVLVIDGPGDKAVTKVYLPYTPETRELISALQGHAPDGFTVRFTGPQTVDRGVRVGRESGEIAGEPIQIEIVHLARPVQDVAADLDLLFERLESHGIVPGEHSVSNRTAFLVEAKDYDRVIAKYSGDRSSGVRGRSDDVSRGATGARGALPVKGQGIGGAGGTRANRRATGSITPDRAANALGLGVISRALGRSGPDRSGSLRMLKP